MVNGISGGKCWDCGFEFDYANVESFYCRPLRLSDQDQPERMAVSDVATDVRVAFLPPMSGLSAKELRLDPGAINVLLGEGRTAEVLRNLCYRILDPETQGDEGKARWQKLGDQIKTLFGITLGEPRYLPERGEITLAYKDRRGFSLDISSSGRGLQQTLLLLAHMMTNPGSVLLLDEPDAHLEILRQRQIYHLLSQVADENRNQLIAASHSEILLNEAADRDVVVAFVGAPHRIDSRGGSQVLKSLKEIGFEQYYQAEEAGWVLYVEGSTDLDILRAFAGILKHQAAEVLERPFVYYVVNQPKKAQEHFHGLREAKPDLVGFALYDRLERTLPSDDRLHQCMGRRREIESYLTSRDTLLAWAKAEADKQCPGPLFSQPWEAAMNEEIDKLANALVTLNKPLPWGGGRD